MKNPRSIFRKILFTLMALPLATVALAQDEEIGKLSDTQIGFYAVIGMVFLVAVIVLGVAIYMLQILKILLRQEEERKAKETGVAYVPEPSLWSKLMAGLTDSVPVEKEETVMLDHEYDGIRELDNHLPPWWTWLFYITIAFSVVYLAVYHVFDALPLQEEEYEIEMAQAEAAAQARMASSGRADIDENTVVFVEDPTALAQGKQVFNNNCAQCHMEHGGGGIGPNLTDDYWLHGGSIKDIFYTVKVGVPEKGMISWEPLLSPQQMQNVSSYIMTMRGSNPPNPKDPQGDLYVPEEEGEGEEVEADSVSVDGGIAQLNE